MTYLVDTNILTRLVDPTHAMHQDALDAVKDFRQYPGITAVSPADILTWGAPVAGAKSP
jgi:hypothetical protein